MWNVHIMFITHIDHIEHRNPETRKTRNDFLVQVRNLLLPLSLRFRHKKERCTIFLWWLFTRPLAWLWRASESQPSSSEPGTQLTDFFQNPKNPPRALPVHDVIHISWSNYLSGIFILTSLNDVMFWPSDPAKNAIQGDAPEVSDTF